MAVSAMVATLSGERHYHARDATRLRVGEFICGTGYQPVNPINPHLILPIGTQVVALVEIRGDNGKPVHPRGAAGVVVRSGAEQSNLGEADIELYKSEYQRLRAMLEDALASSFLLEAPAAKQDLNYLLLRLLKQ
jgi:hypothetical protein